MGESYNKRALSFEDQVKLLQSRGLKIEDETFAKRFLSGVNYYRFSAYCIPFEKNRHEFKGSVSFSNIVRLYEFDRKLLSLLKLSLEQVSHMKWHICWDPLAIMIQRTLLMSIVSRKFVRQLQKKSSDQKRFLLNISRKSIVNIPICQFGRR